MGVTSLLFLDHHLAAAAAVKWTVIMQSYNQYNGYNKDLGWLLGLIDSRTSTSIYLGS